MEAAQLDRVLEGMATLCDRVRDLVVRVEPLSALGDEARLMGQAWRGLDHKGDMLTEKASQIYYSLDDVAGGLRSLEGVKEDVQRLARGMLPLHAVQEAATEAATRLRAVDPARLEGLAGDLGRQLAAVAQRQTEVLRHAEDVAGLRKSLGPLSEALGHPEVGLNARLATLHTLVRSVVDTTGETHRSLWDALDQQDRKLDEMRAATARLSERSDAAKLEALIDGLGVLATRVTGLERGLGVVRSLEERYQRERTGMQGIQHSLDDIRRAIEGGIAGPPPPVPDASGWDADAASRLQDGLHGAVRESVNKLRSEIVTLREGIGALYEETQRQHADTVARFGAQDLKMERILRAMGLDHADGPEAFTSLVSRDVAFRAVPLALRALLKTNAEAPAILKKGDKTAQQLSNFLDVFERQSRLDLAKEFELVKSSYGVYRAG